MLLFAAMAPPRPALDAALGIMRDAWENAIPAPVAPPPGRRGWGRRAKAPQAPAPPLERLDQLAPADVLMTVARFGNLTRGDVTALSRALSGRLSELRPPTVHMAGATVLENAGAHALAVTLEGEVEEWEAIAREMKSTAQRLGLFLDRRDFRAVLPVARLSGATLSPAGSAAMQALADHTGEPWTTEEVCLMRHLSESAPPQEVARLRLG